jgi:cyclase
MLLAAVAMSFNAWAQGIDYAKIEILTDKIAPNLYILSGSAGADPGHQDAAGGRIGVLAGPDGIFLVDSQYAQITDRVVAAIRKISPEPIRFLVNTHVHGDHTAGNANFVKMGALLFAREELREEMLRQPSPANGTPARDPARLPVITYGLGDPVKL